MINNILTILRCAWLEIKNADKQQEITDALAEEDDYFFRKWRESTLL
jgi:hypothetical protein